MTRVEFRVLGPLEAEVDGRPLARMGGRQERLLAVLLLEANRVIPVTRLVEAMWDGRPPPTATRQVQNAVSALRGRLAEAGVTDPAGVLVTQSAGYAMRVQPAELDRLAFEERVRAARGRATDGDVRGAAEELRSVLALWRGPALAGLAGQVIRAGADRLNEARLAAREQWLDLEFSLGAHRDVIGELSALVAEHPLREGLVDRLMLALYRSGRRTEALAVYRRFRARLADEVGLDPSPELGWRHQAILRNDPALELPQVDARSSGTGMHLTADNRRWSPPARPRQLPPDVPDFVGRAALLAELHSLAADADGGRSDVPIAVLAGTAGVGKSALAVHWAHQAMDLFPDGQLYIDLGGHAAQSATAPGQALTALLRGLGVPGEELPPELPERAGLLRSLLADRRMLLLLDNAGSAEQVRPLLPGSPGCLVLVTSRDDLLGLVVSHGARLLHVDVLSAREATELLVRLVGVRRARGTDPIATAELARLCAYLPLALRIAAANLLGHPRWAEADLVNRLTVGNRLDELVVPGDRQNAVRAAFALSHRELHPSAGVLFRRLGLVPGGDLDAALAARLLDRPQATAELDELISAHLVEQHAVGRYRCHDLLRIFAAECAAEEEPAARAACRRRILHHYLDRVRAATQVLGAVLPEQSAHPAEQVFPDAARARAWLDVELSNLVAVVQEAADGQPEAWQLAGALRGHLAAGGHAEAWLATARAGLLAATRAGDLPAQAAMHNNLGTAHWSSAQYDAAIEQLLNGLRLYRRLCDQAGEAAALGNLANVFWQVARLTEAVVHGERALVLFTRIGDRFGEATVRAVLATAHADLGRLDDALEHGGQALAVYRSIGSPNGEASVLNNLAGVYRDRGDHSVAADLAADALRISRRTGFRVIEIDALENLAAIHHLAGRDEVAVAYAGRALTLARESHNGRLEAAALCSLGWAHTGLGRLADALDAFQAALLLADRTTHRRAEVEAMLGLAETARRDGRPEEAARAARQAVDLARTRGLAHLHDRACTLLAACRPDP